MKDVRSLVLSAQKTVIMNTQNQGHRSLFLGEVGGGAVSMDECFPHLRARVNWKQEQTRFPQTQAHCRDPFSLEYQAQWKPCPTSDGATTITQRRNSKKTDKTGRQTGGKEPWNVQFLPKDRERTTQKVFRK